SFPLPSINLTGLFELLDSSIPFKVHSSSTSPPICLKSLKNKF
ncbi:hypothetical protein Mgra_00007177, partial [Meloidogyne graminicola]